MIFSLEVLRAHKGDCLILHYGTAEKPRLMLIDGGPSDVYKPELKPRLIELRDMRGLDPADPLPVDVVMVSHIDDDHIKGIVDLIKEQRNNIADLRLKVGSLWFNSFDDLLTTTPGQLTSSVTASILAGADPGATFDGVEPANEDQHQALDVLSSILQGRTVRDGAEALGWKPNSKFGGELIMVDDGSEPVSLNGLKVTVVGPMKPELVALQEAHDEWVREHKAGRKKTAEAMLAAFTDKSVPNLSSIVVLIEAGDKTMLLTGDARGDKILEGLALVGAFPAGASPKTRRLHVDILKVPHHGSDHNMTADFFRQVTADHYVFSGDGQHGNPERNTFAMLLEGRGLAEPFTIHLTYPIDEIDAVREEKAGNKWSADTDGLLTFFADNPKLKQRVSVVRANEPHLIDLGDAL